MLRHHVGGLLAAALVVCAVAGGPAVGRAASCQHVDLVYYSRDTASLATELAKAASACADYYVSISPTTAAGPRGGAPLTAIHSLGASFHALAELNLNSWMSYATANGWYATGVEFRREMALAGYRAADAWAVNEVGEPTNTQMGIDVTKGTGTARTDLRELVHGLYDGVEGTPDPGVVFAADPLQVTSSLSQYKNDLLSWYSDAPFWDDMHHYVRFWAQETYADAGAWGVAGSTTSDRAAHLNDYFLHGSRLASAGAAATASARDFFADAYTPIGNGSFRWPKPNVVTGIGFGYTDIGLVGMENFVSTQTYALRSSLSSRFGFAVVPLNATASERVTLYDRLAAATQASDVDPSGACGAAGEWCDTSVDGAQFNDAWKTFTDVTPPIVVPVVTGLLGLNGWYIGDVTVAWNVSDPESAFATTGCETTAITADTSGTTLACSATSYGGTRSESVTVKRDATPPVLIVPTDVAVDATTPAGADVIYVATATDTLDSAPMVACTPQSGSVFAIGTTPVACTATDKAGNTATRTFDVHVKGAAEQVVDLEGVVAAAALPRGLEVALLAGLHATATALDSADSPCPHLDAFAALVQSAELVGHVSAIVGDSFVADAGRIAAVAGC